MFPTDFQSIPTAAEQSGKGCNFSQQGVGSGSGAGGPDKSCPAFGTRPKVLGQEPEAEETYKIPRFPGLRTKVLLSWQIILGRKLILWSQESKASESFPSALAPVQTQKH